LYQQFNKGVMLKLIIDIKHEQETTASDVQARLLNNNFITQINK
jgi:hypothetical protein